MARRFCFEDNLKRVKPGQPLRKTLRSISSAKLLIVFAVALSLASLPGPLSLTGVTPTIHLAHANIATAQKWVPAGPSENTLTYPIFTDEGTEFTALQTSPSPIDFTDWPLDQATATSLSSNPGFLVTNPISDTGYFELQFNLANNYWGCVMNFGNAACGRDIRQAFAHGLDKIQFVSAELQGNAQAIDNPVPPSVDLNTPNPCAWDATHTQTGAGCQVNGAGGTAYHLQSSTVAGVACPGTPSIGSFTYTPQCGTPDFCAAADHLIAAGVATGKTAGTCVLTGVSANVAANPVQIFVRSDNTPRLHAGDSYGQFICALLTGAFATGCTGVTVVPGPITSFPGFTTSPTAINNGWWVYTAGFGNVLTFDSSLYFGYNSRYVDGIPSIVSPTGPCSNAAIAGFAPNNYMYICDSTYDSFITQAEFAPCLTAPGDPTTGQVTPTFANCPATSQLSAASAAYQAQDEYGKNAFTIPWWSGKNQFAYLNNAAPWQRAVLNSGDGFEPPGNFFLTLNAWTATPPVAGTIRQGFKQGTTSVNPFIGNTVWEAGITSAVYDSLGATNPNSPQAYMDWMTVSTAPILTAALGYAAPAGTVQAFRYTLRNDIFFQTGQKVTAWDVAFSAIAEKDSGSFVGAGLAPLTGVKVLSPTQVDFDINGVGPFTQLGLSITVLPARVWVNQSVCTSAAWDAAANNPNFSAANSALTACIAPSGFVTGSGVITPGVGGSNIDSSKIAPSFDPVTTANSALVGSGAWVCTSSSTFPPAVSTIGTGCSSSGTSGVGAGGTWTLQRYGRGTTPGGTLNTYFRSTGNLMLWVWSQDRGTFSTDFLNFGQVALCFGKAVGTSGCTVWQHGIGGSAGGTVIGLTQVSIVQRFVGVNWTSPYNWQTSPPQGIDTFPPVLYEGTTTYNPCSIDAVNGYDC